VETNGAVKVRVKPWLWWHSVGLSERLLRELLGSLRGCCENYKKVLYSIKFLTMTNNLHRITLLYRASYFVRDTRIRVH